MRPLRLGQVALCALAQLFIVVTYPPLVRLLVVETLGTEVGGPCPLLALLQGDREDLCLGALVVIQASMNTFIKNIVQKVFFRLIIPNPISL